MKKQLNEFSTGYPVTPLANAQSQEYQGVFGPVDAETVQGNDRLNMKTDEGLHRVNVFLKQFFKKSTLNPSYEISQLRARLNHMGLDFPFGANQPVNPINRFKVSRSEVFGTTPTTDLTKDGFDTGDDQPVYSLEIRVIRSDDGFHMEGQIMPYDSMEESTHMMKQKRNKRIKMVKEMFEAKKQMSEDYEVLGINRGIGAKGERKEAINAESERYKRSYRTRR
jgi:hypothetical protein